MILGETVPGASFTVGELRLPRATMGVLAGFAFGIAGVTFQTMLRNPLASPDIIGISSGASVAAVFGIIVLALDETAVSFLALGGALVTAAAIYLLSHRGGFAGTRLILIGIGVAAMLDSAVTYILSRAAAWDLQTAMQWLTGSLNGATWAGVLPLAVASAVLVPLVLSQGRGLGMLRLGDDSAASPRRERAAHARAAHGLGGRSAGLRHRGERTDRVRRVHGRSDRLAHRRPRRVASCCRPDSSARCWCSSADLVGQFAFDSRYPVGVITGALGAPYLVFLLIRINRSGGSTMTEPHSLSAESLTLAYGDRTIVEQLDLRVPAGRITAIVGANGCGKSTLLRALARLISPRSGQVVLDGKALHGRPTKEIARTLGLLPQAPIAPEGIVVADLVGRGRHPHQKMLARLTAHDYEVVAQSLGRDRHHRVRRSLGRRALGRSAAAGVDRDGARAGDRHPPAGRADDLPRSSPTRSRCSICSPTSTATAARRSSMVLHDMNLAARYADHLFAHARRPDRRERPAVARS